MGEKETDGAGAAERSAIKTKTKSNQSNDRMDAGGGGDPDDDGDLVADGSDPAAAAALKNKTKSNQSNDRMDAGNGRDVDDDGDALDVSERATWTTSNPGIGKAADPTKPRLANQGFRTGEPGAEPPPETDAAKLAPERPVKSEIAIGDPGSHTNLAVGDPGVGPATPKKSN